MAILDATLDSVSRATGSAALFLFACILAWPAESLAQSSDSTDAAIRHAAAPWVGESFSKQPCRNVNVGSFGPYDYTLRASYPSQLRIVENAHFPPEVEHLRYSERMKMYRSFLANLDYVLRAWPNHHRALNTYIRATFDYRSELAIKQYPPAECYLQRAINYSPKDATSYMLYGILLQRSKRPQEALKNYRKAEELQPADLQVKYNLGLLLVEMEEYEQAKEYAQIVYSAKFPLGGLKRKLAARGYQIDAGP